MNAHYASTTRSSISLVGGGVAKIDMVRRTDTDIDIFVIPYDE